MTLNASSPRIVRFRVLFAVSLMAFGAATLVGCGERPAPQNPVRLPPETASSATASTETPTPPEDVERPKDSEANAVPAAETPSSQQSPSSVGSTSENSSTTEGSSAAAELAAEAELPPFARGEWVSLFDGKSIDGWTATKFGGEGDVTIEDGQIVMGQGNDMTGVTTTRGDIPTSNYEIRFEAARLLGNDFFAGLTFPVKKDPCSLILGGWGGGVCGLSSIDGFDASENSSSTFKEFERKRWYSIVLRVTDGSITAWIDGEKLLEQELDGRRISIRAEVELSRPLGFSTWRTTGALRKIEMRRIDPTKPAPAAPEK